MGFMSFRGTIKLVSILDLNDAPRVTRRAIKERLIPAGGVSAGDGYGAGGVAVFRHGRQGFHHGDARSRRLRPDPVAAAQPREQPHHGGQGDGDPDAHRAQTGTVRSDTRSQLFAPKGLPQGKGQCASDAWVFS